MIENNKKSIGWGVSSLITGILSVPLMIAPYFGLPLAIFAIVANNKQKKIVPMGISMAGFILGIIGIVLNSIMLIFVLIGLLIMLGTGTL